VVLSRNARTSEPDAVHLLQHLCSEGKQLQVQRVELASKISLAVETSVEVLSDCVSTLRVAGLFRICSPRYHKAKRVFLSFARTEKFDKQEAVDTLEALIAFRRRETEFISHPHASGAFGIKFKGIQTEFDHFERLASFYRSIDAHFGKPDKKSLRTFLREADVTELELLPGIPPIEVVITYDSLQERIQAAETEVRILQEAIAALRPCVPVFADPKSIDPGELRQLTDAMRSAIDEEVALDECEEVRSIFGGAFQGSRTSTETLNAVVRWAVAAEPHGQLLSTILTADKTMEARSRIAEVLQAESTAQEILARLSETAKIDSTFHGWLLVARDCAEARSRRAGRRACSIMLYSPLCSMKVLKGWLH
jgi:hypothetical protein